MQKGIMLASGGLDSVLSLFKLAQDPEVSEVLPMFVRFNQWPLREEQETIRKAVKWGQGHWLGKIAPLVEPEISWGDDVKMGSVWGRNVAFVGLAASWAYTHGDDYSFIALGVQSDDVSPDCKPDMFETPMDKLLQIVTMNKMFLRLPVAKYTIEDVGRELKSLGVPWEMTMSCYWSPTCGFRSPNDSYRCPGCRRKQMAMAAAGASKEELERPPNGRGVMYQSPLAVKGRY